MANIPITRFLSFVLEENRREVPAVKDSISNTDGNVKQISPSCITHL